VKLSLPNNSIRPCLLALLSVLILPAPAAHAAPLTFFANLSGASETPPTGSPGTGLATIVLDPVAQTLQVNATFSGLTTPDTAAHIHCCQIAPGNPPDRGCRHRGAGVPRGRWLSRVPSGSDVRDLHLRSLRSDAAFDLQSGLCRLVCRRAPTGRGGAYRGDRRRTDIL
jgi:hypothetical protein